VRSGIAISREAGLSYWDGLIVAAARVGGCTRLQTEDLTSGAAIGGVRREPLRVVPWRSAKARGRAVARVVPLGDADQRRVDVDRATIRRILSLPVDEGFASDVDAAEAPVDAE